MIFQTRNYIWVKGYYLICIYLKTYSNGMLHRVESKVENMRISDQKQKLSNLLSISSFEETLGLGGYT